MRKWVIQNFIYFISFMHMSLFPDFNTKFSFSLISALLFFWSCNSAKNEEKSYPTKPITYIVPWSPGGMTDMSSRMMAASLQKYLGVPVNVVNRTGGGGIVGHLSLSRAKSDGYTIGAVTGEITQMHHMGVTQLTYKDYTPLALILNNPAAVTIRADAPYVTIHDLIEDIRMNPGKLQCSGTARGGIWDLARIGFLKAAGLDETDMPWVPSQGAAPALQELLAGGVDVVTVSLAEVDAMRKAGEVRTLAVMSDNRLASFPEVPTLKEAAIDWSIGGWVSVCGPADLDDEAKNALDSAIHLAVRDSAFVNMMTTAGSNLRYMNNVDLSNFMRDEDELNRRLMSDAGLAQPKGQ